MRPRDRQPRRAGDGGFALLAIALVAALVVLLGGPAGASARTPLRLISSQRLDPRLSELSFTTPALADPTGVRVLLPAGYSSSHRRYPVLYLLHGCCNGTTGYRTWTDELGAEALTAGLPLIVVMPDGGSNGGYVNWWNSGSQGPPEWETYHIGQLIPWVDRHYRTTPTRSGRALAGLSMGGDGAIKYAARHPDMFVSASAYSGAVDLNVVRPAEDAVGLGDDRPLGSYATEQIRTRAVNPWDLALNLRGLRLSLRTGNGRDAAGKLVDPVEAVVHAANVSLHDRLDALGIPHVWDDYGAGTHTGPYWTRDLGADVPLIMRTFRHPPAPPKRVSFTAAEPSYEAYGWRVRVRRLAMEFSTLLGAGRPGFALIGSGTGLVTTPRLYAPHSTHPVTVRGESGTRTAKLKADGGGRLRIRVPLGPANPEPQYSQAERATPSRFFRTTVSIHGGGVK
jgi:S-formylglutathione hydrolase FrmB